MTSEKPRCILEIRENKNVSYLLFYVQPDEVKNLSSFNRVTEIFHFSGDSDIFKQLGIYPLRKRKANVSFKKNPDESFTCIIESYTDDSEKIFGRVEFETTLPKT